MPVPRRRFLFVRGRREQAPGACRGFSAMCCCYCCCCCFFSRWERKRQHQAASASFVSMLRRKKNSLLKSEKNEKRSNQKKNTLTALLGREALRQPVQEPLQLDSRGMVLAGRVGLYPGRKRILLGLWGVGVRSLLFFSFLFLLLELDTEPAVEPAARHHRRQGSRDSCQGM